MTRHAKATSAVPAQRQNNGAARLLPVTLAALALVLTLALIASPAHAAKAPLFDFGTSGGQGGQLGSARGIAVNETGTGGVPPGTIYVAEFAGNRISSFEPNDNGTPLNSTDDTYDFIRAWGQDVIVNTGSPANSNGTEFEICDVTTLPPNLPSDCKAGISGAAVGQLNQGGQFKELAGGIAVDPDTGDVSVIDRGNFRIQQFSATGEFERAWGADVVIAGGDGNVAAPAANEQQSVRLLSTGGVVTGGSFTLTFSGQTTAPIDWDAEASEVRSALEALSNVGVGDMSVTGSIAGPWGIEFAGALAATNVDQMSGDATGLIGSGAPNSVSVATAVGGGSVANAFEICEEAAECKAGVSATGAGMFGFGTAIVGIGADEDGNLYVADAAGARVQKFGPAGNFLAMGGWNVTTDGSATDLGNVTTYQVCTRAPDCKAGAGGSGVGQFVGGTAATGTPAFLATDDDGTVYVVGKVNGTIYRLTSNLGFGEEYAETIGIANPTPNRNAMAVNRDDGHLLFAQATVSAGKSNTYIFELDPVSGSIVSEHPGDANYTPAADGDQWVGLAIDSGRDRILGARTTSAGSIRAFEEGPPSVSTAAAINNTGTRATLKGTVNPNAVTVDQCFFEWGPTTAYGNTAPCDPNAAGIGSGTSPVDVKADITGLAPNGATYHFRLKAVNAKGSGLGLNQSFTTPDTVVTTAATAMTNSGATLNGTVNPDTVAITDCLFEWGTTTAYGQTAPCDPNAAGIGNGTSPVAVEADLSGLHPGTPYHFRLKATNDDGFVLLGDDLSFQTLGPRIAATWSEEVAIEEAILKAEIDPEGSATTYRFEWGLAPCSANPCAQVPVPDGPVGSDSAIHEVTRFLEGLEPGTTYHYRVVATNAAAENEGPDRTFTTFTRLDSDADCSNQDVRIGASAFLPECRAYEMVSPIDKNGGDIETAEQEAGVGNPYSSAYRQASIHGGKITYSSATSFGDSIGAHWSNQYLSTRGEDGWSTHAISSRRGQTISESSLRWQTYPFFGGFTPDLSSAWIRDNNVDPLTPEALNGYANLYRRDNLADSYEALTIGSGPFDPNPSSMLSEDGVTSEIGGPRVVGYSSDLRHQIFTASAALTPNASHHIPSPLFGGTNTQLYDLVDGQLHLVSVLPNGQASSESSFTGTSSIGRLVETRNQMLKNAVSDDGSRIFWTASQAEFGPGELYVRENPGAVQSASGACDEPGKACTRHIAGALSPPQLQAQFWAASADGSKVLYSVGDHPNRTLHLLDLDAEPTEKTVNIAGGSRAVVATAEDLSHVYFVSSEDLDEDGPAETGEHNLYLYRYQDDAYSFVGRLSGDDVTPRSLLFSGSEIWMASTIGLDTASRPQPILNQTRITPDGSHFAFMSNNAAFSDAVGYDNTDVVTGKPDFQVYRYDAEAGELTCASCNPSGARPRGELIVSPYSPLEWKFTNFPDLRAASSIPTHEHDNYASRILSDNGDRLFFHSDEALLPRDTNGVQDVYQWQAVGTGGCDSGDADYYEQNDGCLYLISSGRDGSKSEFVDADPTGDEVFFSTDESLDPRDPGLRDIYVAKTGGGFAIPQATAPCEGEACQSPPAPPSDPTPNSLSFQGPGNPPQGKASKPRCPKGKRRVKARGGKTRCVKRNNAKRAKRANNDRRANR